MRKEELVHQNIASDEKILLPPLGSWLSGSFETKTQRHGDVRGHARVTQYAGGQCRRCDAYAVSH